LKIAGRTDLIGSGKNCLVTAPKGFVNKPIKKKSNKKVKPNYKKKRK